MSERVGRRISDTQTERYRGYDLVWDTVGCDIWNGSDYVSTERDQFTAKKVIDAWLDAR